MKFTYDLLERRLKERVSLSIKFIHTISQDDVLSLDTPKLSDIIAHFSIQPPILLWDSMYADERIIESLDSSFERKSGRTYHSFMIPVEGEIKWLEEIDYQITEPEDFCLALFDEKRSRITIRLGIGPDDRSGTLNELRFERSKLVTEYVNSLIAKINSTNQSIAQSMTIELAKRKEILLKARKELESSGLPQRYNPEHEERALKNQELLRNLVEGWKNMGQSSIESNLSLVLVTMDVVSKAKNSSYVRDQEIVQECGLSIQDVRDCMDILEERRLIHSANSASRYMGELTANGRATLKDANFKSSHTYGSIVVQGNHGVVMNIGSTLSHVTQTIEFSPNFSENKKQKLSELVAQLKEALTQVPPEQKDEAEIVADMAQDLVNQAAKEKPHPLRLSISADGLKKAAKNLTGVVDIVAKVVALIQGAPE